MNTINTQSQNSVVADYLNNDSFSDWLQTFSDFFGSAETAQTLLQQFATNLTSFASDAEFVGKMESVFGEGNDYSSLQAAFDSGNFESIPRLEILSDSELRGANAAYASKTNTIYFSTDFLQQSAENVGAINSVLLEEFGHYVDAQVNEVDTKGDEGEYFLNVVQGIDLSASQVQVMQAEDDSALISTESSFIQIEQSTSNNYNWGDFNTVLDAVIKNRGKTKVFFINGILTPSGEFNTAIKDTNLAYNLKKEIYTDVISHYDNSIEFHDVGYQTHNPSSSPVGNQSTGFPDTLAGFRTEFSTILFKPSISSFEEDFSELNLNGYDVDTLPAPQKPNKHSGITDEEYEQALAAYEQKSERYNQYIEGYKIARKISGDTIKFGNLKKENIQDLTKFVSVYFNKENGFNSYDNDLKFLEQELENYSLAGVPNDLLESFYQFWNEKPSKVSAPINSKWTQEVKTFLSEDDKNSVIFIAHSQGNYFLEDALENDLSDIDSSRFKIVSLGSPTDYSQLNLKYTTKKNDETIDSSQVSGIDVILRKNNSDPVTDLRFEANTKTAKEKFQHFLETLDNIVSISGIGKGLAIDHSLGSVKIDNLTIEDGYLKDSAQGGDFNALFNLINSDGYYFPKRPQYLVDEFVDSTKGTDYGDWIEGSSINDNWFPLSDTRIMGYGGNDVLRGNQGNDYLIGGRGWDFIDGGEGVDEASYEDIGNGVTIYQLDYAGSDIYRVDDAGTGEQDYLVGIEKISGTNQRDYFLGGHGIDIFYGRNGNDEFHGGNDNDELYGGEGQDVIHGDSGNDRLEGNSGNDFLYGGSDNDTVYGGSGGDYFEGDSGNDEFFGGSDNDTAYGGLNNDILVGEGGKDTLYGGDDDDEIYGNKRWWKWDFQDDTEEQDGPNQPTETSFTIAGTNFSAEASTRQLSATSLNANTSFTAANPDVDSDDVIYGGNGNDRIDGDLGNDRLHGDADNDIIYGGVGNDYLDGGTGNDKLNGAEDNDLILGGDGSDELFGESGADVLSGGNDNDYLDGGTGNDRMGGDAGDDELYGRLGNDTLSGGSGEDNLFGEEGNDQLNGDAGDDNLYGGDGADILNGGDNDDYLDGGTGNDRMGGDAGDDELYGRLGDDTLSGGSGEDNLFGEEGNDQLNGDAGDDNLYGGDGEDILSGGDNDDRLIGESGNDSLYGETGDDRLDGDGGDDFLDGGSGDDTLGGGNGEDTLFGRDGDDHMNGGAGRDLLHGEAGDDRLSGDAGNDTLYGGLGDDTLDGGDNQDLLYGGDGDDRMNGGSGNDTLYGEAGDDKLFGDDGKDTLIGGQGNDTLDGGEGSDLADYSTSPSGIIANLDECKSYKNRVKPGEFDLEPDFKIGKGQIKDGYGNIDKVRNLERIIATPFNDIIIGNHAENHIDSGAGDDLLIGNAGNDTLLGGAGNDTVSYRRDPGAVHVDLRKGIAHDGFCDKDKLVSIENIVGSKYNDTLLGDNIANTILGGDGDDLIRGRDGNDTLKGEDGNDEIHGDRGNDLLTGDRGDDHLLGGSGNDTLNGGRDNDWLEGGDGDDHLLGGKGNDHLEGGTGNDTLFGEAGNDLLYGQSGNDILNGGTGHDCIHGGSGNDQIFGGDGKDYLDGGTGDDTITGGLGKDKLFGHKGNDLLYGNEGKDLLDGGAGDDTLDGGEDNDTLYGQKGSDLLNGGAGNDFLDGGKGYDTLAGGLGNDELWGGKGYDLLDGGDGRDRLDGGKGYDTLLGGLGNDLLDAGDGDDLLNGGLGNDELWGGRGSDTFVLAAGQGLDSIFDFALTQDFFGLSGGLSFDQLVITQGSGSHADDTFISLQGSNEILASVAGVQAIAIDQSHFTTFS